MGNITNPNSYKYNFGANIYNHIVNTTIVKYVPRIIMKISAFSLWNWCLVNIGVNHVIYLIIMVIVI
jgi:hypothetical protein